MNIGEAIALLQAKANELPTGYNTEIRVVMCDGEGIETTRILEIDHMATVHRETGQTSDLFAIIKDTHTKTIRPSGRRASRTAPRTISSNGPPKGMNPTSIHDRPVPQPLNLEKPARMPTVA